MPHAEDDAHNNKRNAFSVRMIGNEMNSPPSADN